MYYIMALIGFLIRQFLLPNPFEPFGGWGALYNLFASGLIGTLAYFTVGLIYEKRSFPFIGSLLYTIAYAVYTLELYFILKPYPNDGLIILFLVLVAVINTFIIRLISKAIK